MLLGPYSSIMDDELRRIYRRIHNARTKTVVHHETCPCCGKKLVNLYRRDVEKFENSGTDVIRKMVREWKCKACWDKEDE